MRHGFPALDCAGGAANHGLRRLVERNTHEPCVGIREERRTDATITTGVQRRFRAISSVRILRRYRAQATCSLPLCGQSLRLQTKGLFESPWMMFELWLQLKLRGAP